MPLWGERRGGRRSGFPEPSRNPTSSSSVFRRRMRGLSNGSTVSRPSTARARRSPARRQLSLDQLEERVLLHGGSPADSEAMRESDGPPEASTRIAAKGAGPLHLGGPLDAACESTTI